jgi:hypothetical protein
VASDWATGCCARVGKGAARTSTKTAKAVILKFLSIPMLSSLTGMLFRKSGESAVTASRILELSRVLAPFSAAE